MGEVQCLSGRAGALARWQDGDDGDGEDRTKTSGSYVLGTMIHGSSSVKIRSPFRCCAIRSRQTCKAAEVESREAPHHQPVFYYPNKLFGCFVTCTLTCLM